MKRFRGLYLSLLGAMIGLAFASLPALGAEPYLRARRFELLPTFFVPEGEPRPTAAQIARLVKHLQWTQRSYRKLLGGRDTFRIAERPPLVYQSRDDLLHFLELPEAGAGWIVGDLLAHLKLNRFNNPYLFVIVFMNSRDGRPAGGGRPLNGGYNTGGGLVIIASLELDKNTNFQSTLEHEIGHGLGLPHVSVYGYDMAGNDSLMSYNLKHHTKGFAPAPLAPVLIPEDIRALAYVTRAFPKLKFDSGRDIPADYEIYSRPVWLGPLWISGQPSATIRARTGSGETYGTRIFNLVQSLILPSKGPGLLFDPGSMWQSAESKSGWVSFEITLPMAALLDGMSLHTEHSGVHHRARALRILAGDGKAHRFRKVYEGKIDSADERVKFPPTRARTWKIELKSGPTKQVTVRGLRFFSGGEEIFPPYVPYRKP